MEFFAGDGGGVFDDAPAFGEGGTVGEAADSELGLWLQFNIGHGEGEAKAEGLEGGFFGGPEAGEGGGAVGGGKVGKPGVFRGGEMVAGEGGEVEVRVDEFDIDADAALAGEGEGEDGRGGGGGVGDAKGDGVIGEEGAVVGVVVEDDLGGVGGEETGEGGAGELRGGVGGGEGEEADEGGGARVDGVEVVDDGEGSGHGEQTESRVIIRDAQSVHVGKHTRVRKF